jgi:DNA mismatch endonuclease (patch repair protein)
MTTQKRPIHPSSSITDDYKSLLMSRVRSKNTKPELIIRSLLHREGLRFRLHRSDLPGKPDLVLPRYRVAIFVDGCFWHQHSGCAKASLPKTNQEFWSNKLAGNAVRDVELSNRLLESGWGVIRIWECALKKDAAVVVCIIRSILNEPSASSGLSIID